MNESIQCAYNSSSKIDVKLVWRSCSWTKVPDKIYLSRGQAWLAEHVRERVNAREIGNGRLAAPLHALAKHAPLCQNFRPDCTVRCIRHANETRLVSHEWYHSEGKYAMLARCSETISWPFYHFLGDTVSNINDGGFQIYKNVLYTLEERL